jgi:protein O-mannosyl-transferase
MILAPNGKVRTAVWICAVATVTFLAYSNTFDVPFIFDDRPRITENAAIQQLWPLSGPMTDSNRPFGMITFAINYALHGYEVWGYHATNLAIHILAGLTLFGIVRRTLSRGELALRYQASATPLAFAVALLWLVHPLNTQAVTYIIQRLESLMGLCYLLTLYCFIRAQDSPKRAAPWYIASVCICALGMGVKEVMVTAPIMVLWYHRAFVAKSWKTLFLGPARFYYSALFATWVVLAWAMLRNHTEYESGAIGVVKGITPIEYLLSQAGVITHYLKLSVWPNGQCLDYGWPVARTAGEILPPILFIGTLSVATLWAIFRYPRWGFLGGWFFVTLGPTSSVVPIVDLAFEQRMYLPLMAIIALFVFAAGSAFAYMADHRYLSEKRARWIIAVTVALLTLQLSALTWGRNEDFRNEISLWQDTIAKAPRNPRAYYNLARIKQGLGDFAEAENLYQETIRLNPDDPQAYSNLGDVLKDQGKLKSAIDQYHKAISLWPTFADAYNNLGSTLFADGKYDLAGEQFRQAIHLRPDFADAYSNLSNVLKLQGKSKEAIELCREAIRRRPDLPEAYNNLGNVLLAEGTPELAEDQYRKAVQVKPNFAEAYHNLGHSLLAQGKFDLAAIALTEAVRLRPNDAEAYHKLGHSLHAQGKHADAITMYSQAIRLKPDFAEAYHNRSIVYFDLREYDQAWAGVNAARKLGLTPPEGYLQALSNASGRSE